MARIAQFSLGGRETSYQNYAQENPDCQEASSLLELYSAQSRLTCWGLRLRNVQFESARHAGLRTALHNFMGQ